MSAGAPAAPDPDRAWAKSRHHLRMREELLAEQATSRALQRQLGALAVEYRKTRDMLHKSQLANTMLRRLFCQERERKFHAWLKLLEYEQPGRLFAIFRVSYRYLDNTTCIRHRAVCSRFLRLTPEHCTVVKLNMCRRNLALADSNSAAAVLHLDQRGLRRLVGSMTGALEASFVGFNRPEDARLFCPPRFPSSPSSSRPHSSLMGLANCQCLIALDLSRSRIGSSLAIDLGRCADFPCLEILRLEDNALYSEGLHGLFAPRALGTKSLRYLYLPDNMLQQDCDGKYCDRGLIALGHALEGAGCRRLQVLDLSRNFLDDGGIHAIAPGLANCSRLRVFRAQWDAPRGIPAPVYLQSEGKQVDGIELYKNMQTWRRMRKKNAARTQTRHGISDTGALLLARSLATIVREQQDLVAARRLGSGPLEVVDMRSHRIGNAGCVALARAVFAIRAGSEEERAGRRAAAGRRGTVGALSVVAQKQQRHRRGQGTVSRSDTHRRNAENQQRKRLLGGQRVAVETESGSGSGDDVSKIHHGPARLLLHGNPTIGADAIQPLARLIGFESAGQQGEGASFQAMDKLKELFGIFEPHTFSEKEEENAGQKFADNERQTGRGRLADDFALQVRAAVARRRRSAAIAATKKAAAARTARFRRRVNRPRLPLLPLLNNTKENGEDAKY